LESVKVRDFLLVFDVGCSEDTTLALMETASFFAKKKLHFTKTMRSKKDTVDSRFPAPKNKKNTSCEVLF
jgi:hypothetical protein